MSSSTILLILLVVTAVFAVVLYNRLVSLRNRFRNAFSQIDVQLQRRYELIPNLVETASAYMKHENETLVAVTQARNLASESCSKAAKDPSDSSLVGALASAETALNGAMGRFSMVMENYPDLKADSQMLELHEELTSTENRIAFARQAYSDSVMIYNTAREQFPAILVANALSFKNGDLFEVSDEQMKKAVTVDFSQSRAA